MVFSVRPNARPGAGRAKVTAGQQQATQAMSMPSPILGVNVFDSLADMGPQDSVYSYNMVPSEYGNRTRRGFKEWNTTLGGAANAVRTMIPFEGNIPTQDKLFAATILGIYDVTASAASPAAAISFGTQTDNAGYGTFEAYNNDNGDHFLIYADRTNGLYEYDLSGPSWAAKTDITGVADSDLVFVTEHKNRLWFVEADTSNAWYLALGAKGGAATRFSLGNKFRRGGSLRGIYKWSVDGGDGIDDLLIFVSSAGEVAVYEGTDPSSAATWQSRGTWFIGAIPDSNRIAENIGGDLHLISVYGLISMQDLVSGVAVEKATGQNSIARRITRFIRNDMVDESGDQRWDIVPIPSEGSVAIVRPFTSGGTTIQYIFNFTKAGWGLWRGVPMNSCIEWKGSVYIGDDVGNVHVMLGSRDNVLRDGSGGDPVEFSFLTAYSDLGAPGLNKRVHFIRPRFFSENGVEPSFGAIARYDYDINEVTQSLSAAGSSAGLWDVSVWDTAIWGGTSVVSTRMIGSSGIGQLVAVAIRGEVTDRTTYLDSSIYADVGGAFL